MRFREEEIVEIRNKLEKLQDKFLNHVRVNCTGGKLVPTFSESATPEVKEAYHEFIKLHKKYEEVLIIR